MSKTETRKTRSLPGPVSLFRQKIRQPVSLTLTRRHHALLNAAMARLRLTRADTLALLIENYADRVELPHDLPTPDTDDT